MTSLFPEASGRISKLRDLSRKRYGVKSASITKSAIHTPSGSASYKQNVNNEHKDSSIGNATRSKVKPHMFVYNESASLHYTPPKDSLARTTNPTQAHINIHSKPIQCYHNTIVTAYFIIIGIITQCFQLQNAFLHL